jgi:hypothetical protein
MAGAYGALLEGIMYLLFLCVIWWKHVHNSRSNACMVVWLVLPGWQRPPCLCRGVILGDAVARCVQVLRVVDHRLLCRVCRG